MSRAAAKSHSSAHDFAGSALEKHWPRLHRGDCEPFPAASTIRKLVGAHPDLDPGMPIERAADRLQEAWRAFHRGAFHDAERLGLALGRLGFNVANKAANIHATYLEHAKQKKIAAFLEVVRRAEELQGVLPNAPNAWYLHAQALGRYAQSLSVVKALAEGIAGKVKTSLDKTLRIEPHHADAHIALGAYHAEVIGKIGSLVGSLTYGASTDAGVRHFERALKLNPDCAIARIEFANGLLLMFGDAKEARATRLYQEAAECVPADATERLDIELARAELED